MNYPEIFLPNFISNLKDLAKDKVVGVRLTLIEILTNHIINKGPLS